LGLLIIARFSINFEAFMIIFFCLWICNINDLISKINKLVESVTSYKLLYPLYYIVVIDSIIALSINFENC
jgi:hypothetical protein